MLQYEGRGGGLSGVKGAWLPNCEKISVCAHLWEHAFTLLGFKHVCWHVTTFPYVLESLSEGILIAAIHKVFLASLLCCRKLTWWSYHQARGSASLSVVGGQEVAAQFGFHSLLQFHRRWGRVLGPSWRRCTVIYLPSSKRHWMDPCFGHLGQWGFSTRAERRIQQEKR